MPLLPALPIFHSSSSSKSAKLSFVTSSSTTPSFESTPPATCQPAGNPGSFQPRQSGALSSFRSDRQGPGAVASAPASGAAAQQTQSSVVYRGVLSMAPTCYGLPFTRG